jgi:hypothetical protein
MAPNLSRICESKDVWKLQDEWKLMQFLNSTDKPL